MEYGLIGKQIGYSISPQIHRSLFRALGIRATYDLMPVAPEQIPTLPQTLRRMRGVNITIPYKTALLELCDEVAPEARAIGSINTIDCRDGKLCGYNTDYDGFARMVDAVGFTAQHPPGVCAVLGTGGASLPVVRRLRDIGAERVVRVSRTPRGDDIGYDALRALHGNLLVNTTPVGTFPNVDDCPVDAQTVGRFSAVLDLTYNPPKTKLLRIAQQMGLKTCSGLIMLVVQAVRSEEIWQRTAIPESVVESVYAEMKALLENRS